MWETWLSPMRFIMQTDAKHMESCNMMEVQITNFAPYNQRCGARPDGWTDTTPASRCRVGAAGSMQRVEA